MGYRIYARGDEARMFKTYPAAASGQTVDVAMVPILFLDELMERAGYKFTGIDELFPEDQGWRPPPEPRTFDEPPATIKRPLHGETQPLPEGDWQLHDDGHEGEDKE